MLANVCRAIVSALPQFTQPFGRQIDVLFRGALRLFLERVQDHDTVRQSRQINHAERAAAVTQPQFTDARSDRLHRLPVVGVQSALNPVQLIAGGPPSHRRKVAQARECIAYELERLHRGGLYQNRYKTVNLMSSGIISTRLMPCYNGAEHEPADHRRHVNAPDDPMTDNLPEPRPARLFDASVVDLIIRVACLALLLYWTAQIILPFLPIMAWSVILAVVLYPGFVWCTKRLRLPPMAAALLMTATSLAVLFGPITWLSLSLIDSLRLLGHRLEHGDIPIPPPGIAVKSWPLIGAQLFTLWDQASTNLEAVILQIGPELKPFAGTLLSFASSSGISMLSFVIAVALSGFLLVPGPALADKARAVVRHVDAKHGDEFMHLTSVTIRNLARGVIGVSLLQALLIGIGLIVAGIPGAGLLALCALISGILQIGTMIVVVPVLIFAWLTMSHAAALVLTLYLVPVGVLDTFLRPIVMAHGLKTPMLVILIGVLGGVLVHGMIGVFVGPVVLAIAWELLAAWTRDGPVTGEAAPPGAGKMR